MPEEFDYKIVLTICHQCKSCYMRDHPEDERYLKCGLCGFCIKKESLRAMVETAMRAKDRIIH